MTTQTVIVDFYAGETLGGTLHNETTDALVATADTTAEITANGAVYAFVFGEVAIISASRYRLKILSAGAVVGTRTVRFTGVDGEIVQSGQHAELDPADEQLLADLRAMLFGSPSAPVFTAQALANSPAGGGTGRALEWAGNVGPGGVLELTLGDDHETANDNHLPIRVHDVGGTLYALLTGVGVTLQWSAGQNLTGGLIAGTVAGVTHAADVTTVTVEIPNCAATGNVLAPYVWQLQRTVGGRRASELQGTLRLRADMF